MEQTAQKATAAPAKTFKPISEMTDEERRQLYAQRRREQAGKSRLDVKGEPGIHYFWAEKDDDAEIIRMKADGYWVVKETDVTKPKIRAAGLKEDGTYSFGSVILMACTEETYQLHLLDVEMRGEELRQGAVIDFQVEQEKRGVPTFETDRGRKG